MSSFQRNNSFTSKKENELPRALVETLSGITAGFLNTVVVHPLDVIKTRLQVNRYSHSHFGASYQLFREIATNEGGLRALYRGLTPNIIGNTAGWGLYFLWYGEFKELILNYRVKQGRSLSSADYLLASATAGTLSQICTNPVWVIKTRMLSSGRCSPGAYRSMSEGLTKILKEEGVRGLFRGLIPSLFGVTHGAFQFMFYEKLKEWRREHRRRRLVDKFGKDSRGPSSATSTELGNLDFIALSALSKILAGTVTYPYQVIRARLQNYDASQVYVSARDVLRKIWRTEGLQGYYKGLGPNIMRVLPSTCITFLVYENVRYYLQ